jgi:hypothetical protein
MFDQVMARTAGRFGRVDPVRVLALTVDRKNCWQLAEEAGLAGPGPMQRLPRYAAGTQMPSATTCVPIPPNASAPMTVC